MSRVDVKVTIAKDNTSEVKRAMEAKIPVALEAVGLQAEAHTKLNLNTPKSHKWFDEHHPQVRPSVDSATLVNSITHMQSDEHTEAIGSGVEYSVYVEMGTQHAQAYPYLKPAIEEHVDEYKQIIEKYLKA